MDMKDGHKFFSPYLISEDQYYASLSFEQERKLYIDAITYFVYCSDRDLNIFLIEYENLKNKLE